MVDNVRLPVSVEQGALGGPRFQTQIQTAVSGHEQRIADWDQARGEWDISYGIRTRDELMDVIKVFRSRGGRAEPLRFKDWTDFEVEGQAFGTGDGTTDEFQLYKTYTDGVLTHNRTITHPVSGTVVIYVAGTAKTETTHYTINYSTGVVTFTSGNIPTAGQALTWDGDFDVPVRFDDDHLRVNMRVEEHGEIPEIRVVEVLDE